MYYRADAQSYYTAEHCLKKVGCFQADKIYEIVISPLCDCRENNTNVSFWWQKEMKMTQRRHAFCVFSFFF